jgi:hypothetical protein
MIRELFTDQYRSGSVEFSVNGARGIRYFECDWDEKLYVRPRLGEMMYDNFPMLVCVDCRLDPFPGCTVVDFAPEKCLITAEYSTVLPADLPLECFSFGCEVLNLAEGRHWSDGTLNEQPQASPFPISEYTVELTVDTLPTDVILALTGKVNKYEFAGCPAETILFNGANSRAAYDDSGNWRYRIAYNFTYKPHGHNWIWNKDKPGGADWDYFQEPLYGTADFSMLGIRFKR